MTTTMKLAAIAIALVVIVSPAFADNDGDLTLGGAPVGAPVAIDVSPDSVDRSELAPAVRGELDGLRADTDANTAGVASNVATNASQQTQIDANAAKNVQQDATLVNHGGRISDNEDDIDALFDKSDQLRRDLRDARDELEGGIAVANSLNIPHVDPTKSFALSGNGGFYEGNSALGVGMALRFDDTWQAGGSIGVGLGDGGFGGKAAITGQW